MRIEQMVLGMVGTNCYLAVNEAAGQLVIIDPADDPQRIMQKIEQTGAVPAAILLTHGHFDHIGAASALKEHYQIPVCCMRQELDTLRDPQINLTGMGGRAYTMEADTLLEDGQELALAGLSIRVLHTPGHTAGGACYYVEEAAVLFAGDTLFQESVGRTDFPTGSMGQLVRSVREKLLTLPGDTRVLPGHGPATSIEWEQRHNPFL
ncbi:MAG: MBL fold metallo-hydrolase [Lachnospiraceae bacterium]|nr:MBL fold metallo-hydrolase [Lachnospiraceae bacterium]